jgi:branched-chain amino acid transport system substrate-binding protein
MWGQLDTNKQVGGLFPNDGDGNAWGDPNVGFPPVLDKLGYGLTDPGRYQNLTDDFSAQINAFKQGNVEIVTGVPIPPDFTTFWNQAKQQGFNPKAASIGKAILFPQAVEALGDAGNNLSSEVWWSPSHPFKSSLNGLSAGEVAAAYTQATGKQWTQPIGFVHALFELATNVMGRVSDAGDGDAVAEAIAASNLQTIVGPIAFDGKGLPPFAARNICKTPAGRRPVAAQGRRRLRSRHRRQLRPAVDPDRWHDAADQLIPRLAGLGDTSPGLAFPDPSEQPIQCPFLPSRTYPRALAP